MLLHEERTPHQLIRLSRDDRSGVCLHLDGMLQFAEVSEHRYHECLAVAPALFGVPRRVFIAGGGDGLAARRLLRFPEVERIIVCDYDPAVTELARTSSELLRLNAQSLHDERVTVVNADAVAWLEATDERFDLVICDFPDPYYPGAGKLYGLDFYTTIRERLTERGVMVTQTLVIPEVVRLVRATVRAVFPHEGYYQLDRGNGFTLGALQPLVPRVPVPAWTTWLSSSLGAALFALPKDLAARCDPAGMPPNRDDTIVEAALARGIGSTISEPHPYLPATSELYLSSETTAGLTAGQVDLIIRGMAAREDLIVAIAEPLAGLRRFWARLDDGSVAHIEARTCRPDRDAVVGELLGRYLERFSERFYDAPGSALDLSRFGRYAITSDPQGRPVGLFKLLRLVNRPELAEIEVIFGVGTARQSFLSILLLLGYLERSGVLEVQAYAPAGVFGRSFLRMGARKVDTLRTFVRRA